LNLAQSKGDAFSLRFFQQILSISEAPFFLDKGRGSERSSFSVTKSTVQPDLVTVEQG